MREHHRGCSGRWRGLVSLGFGPDGKRVRRKVSGRTKTEVKDKLKDCTTSCAKGSTPRPTYTVQNAVTTGWHNGLHGRSAKTISTNREVLAPLTALDRSCEAQGADCNRRQVGAGEARRYPVHQDSPDRPQRRWSGRSGTRRRTTSWAGTSPRSSTSPQGPGGTPVQVPDPAAGAGPDRCRRERHGCTHTSCSAC